MGTKYDYRALNLFEKINSDKVSVVFHVPQNNSSKEINKHFPK